MQPESLPQGSIIKLSFDPTKGHEQSGYRPALVVSNNDFNHVARVVRIVPITNNTKRFPLHVLLDGRTKTTGSILTEYIKTIDPMVRDIVYVEKCPKDKVDEVVELLVESVQ